MKERGNPHVNRMNRAVLELEDARKRLAKAQKELDLAVDALKQADERLLWDISSLSLSRSTENTLRKSGKTALWQVLHSREITGVGKTKFLEIDEALQKMGFQWSDYDADYLWRPR